MKRTKLTIKEYKQLKGKAEAKFREKSFELSDKEFVVQIYRKFRVKRGRAYVSKYLEIGASEFIPNRDYRIFIKHKKTRQRRLLGIGKFRDIPIRSKDIDRFQYQLGGRKFDASLKYPKKAKGKWIPVDRIVAGIQREIQEHAMEKGVEARGAIIPMKRYFHTDWLIYSDHILKGNTLVKKVFVNCAVEFIYPQQQWIGKQSILIEFQRKMQLKKLHLIQERLEKRINSDLSFLHSQADDISLVQINGFLPIGV